ncbi:uncharacterized protein PITG_12313 [Phytophthora infestans T30-4]|uniref:Uncharacterized protein n=1 Tax=Phytophthora infestans (strain T30-4) TaxID=403677 RepID=D0NJK5_PHYIT|nr:uncharacterized protein PITG_12313 [Phytophthora infestans T30-4]EEY59723.1 hypothetical protein PITG_12313 [Phytophthora infestans T30-4]|eukprot:XP_002900916.1 hypothetical protein PITG_12313 [Phytophthora infestans T30-4]
MTCVNKLGGRALLVGGVAAWLTAISTGEDWFTKDYLFVLAVVLVVFIGGFRKAKYESLALHEKLQRAHDLENVEFIHNDPVQLKQNKVTCILFFGTWCKKSREALESWQRTRSKVAMLATSVSSRNSNSVSALKLVS